MAESASRKYSVNLSFEEIRLPPLEDIMIVGKKSPHGKLGLTKSFQYLVPNEFEVFEIEDEAVEAVFINKKILKKINYEYVIKMLRTNVFPYVSAYEILKVEFKLRIFYESIEGEFAE